MKRHHRNQYLATLQCLVSGAVARASRRDFRRLDGGATLSRLLSPGVLAAFLVFVPAGSNAAPAGVNAAAARSNATPAGVNAAPPDSTGTGASARTAVSRLSLEESIELALANNKQVLIQKQEVEVMEGRVVQARAGALPNLSADTRYIKSGGTMNFGGSEGFTFDIDDAYLETTVSLLQPIYTAGRTGAALRAANAARAYARENELAATEDVVYQVKASFGGVLLAKHMSALAGEGLALAEAHRGDVEELFNEGLASEYELIRARVRVAELVPEHIRSKNELQRSLIVFRNSLGLSADESVEPDGELVYNDVHISTAEAFSLARERRHEVYAAKLYAKGMRAALDLARADRYPSLALAGSASMNTEEASLEPDRWRSRMWTLALGVSIPVFDGLYTKGKIRQSRAQYEQALLYAAQMEDLVRLEVEQAVSRVEESRELVQSQLASVEQAQKGLDIANIRYENGVGTQLEVLDSQVALSRAKANYFVSVFEQFMAVAEIERATGAGLE